MLVFNLIFKYADDTNVLVPEDTDVSLSVEYDRYKQWADLNHLVINHNKNREIVFHLPRVLSLHFPPKDNNIERVSTAKLVGIMFQSNLNFDTHIQYVLTLCDQQLYLMKLLRSRGMCPKQIYKAFHALPAWGGFVSVEQTDRINAFLKRCYRYGYVDKIHCLSDLLNSVDLALFDKCNLRLTVCIYCSSQSELNLNIYAVGGMTLFYPHVPKIFTRDHSLSV